MWLQYTIYLWHWFVASDTMSTPSTTTSTTTKTTGTVVEALTILQWLPKLCGIIVYISICGVNTTNWSGTSSDVFLCTRGVATGGISVYIIPPKSVTVLFTCGTLTRVLKLQWLVKQDTPPQSNSWLRHCYAHGYTSKHTAQLPYPALSYCIPLFFDGEFHSFLHFLVMYVFLFKRNQAAYYTMFILR